MSQSYLGVGPDALRFRGVLARRFCALIADGLLIGIVCWASIIGIFLFGIVTLGFGFLLFHLVPVLPFLYATLLLPTGGTIGQRLFGLSVREDGDLQRPPNHAEAFVWSLLFAVSVVFAFLPFLLVFTNPRHRAGHDLLSGLTVIRTD